jgi:hypothetical protein
MTEDEARQVELVRALETEDRAMTLLTREDREQAEAHARREEVGAGRRAGERFVVRRAEFAAARLETRHPGIAGLLKRSRWPGWIGLALPPAALVAGFLATEFGTSRRLELLAAPLLGTIAWNVAAYLMLLAAALAGKGAAVPAAISRGIAGVTGQGGGASNDGTPLNRAAALFRQRWAQASSALNAARTARTLHLAAALFALGLIGGIYLRALVIEYRAGWESTFLSPAAVRTVLATVLGPASAATGVAIPPLDQIAAMRWAGPSGGGVNAGPWIHLYTATMVGLVVIPRLVLALWQGARALRLARGFRTGARDDFYIRRLLRSASDEPARIRVTPYAYRPGEETSRRLAHALRAALGDAAQVRFDEAIDYGAEETWLAAHPQDPNDDYHLLLFTLSATPEEENHGALAAGLSARIAHDHPATVLAAVIDESPFRAHFAGQTGLDQRVATRLAAWRAALARASLVPLGLDLSDAADEALAQRIEAGLLPDGALRR